VFTEQGSAKHLTSGKPSGHTGQPIKVHTERPPVVQVLECMSMKIEMPDHGSRANSTQHHYFASTTYHVLQPSPAGNVSPTWYSWPSEPRQVATKESVIRYLYGYTLFA